MSASRVSVKVGSTSRCEDCNVFEAFRVRGAEIDNDTYPIPYLSIAPPPLSVKGGVVRHFDTPKVGDGSSEVTLHLVRFDILLNT